MWKSPGTPIPIDKSQLVVGLYIWLDMKWDEHSFVSNRFMVRTDKDIAALSAHAAAGKLYYYPGKSAIQPLPKAPKPAAAVNLTALQAADQAALAQQLQAREKSKKEKLRQQRDTAARADRAWESAARTAREALIHLARSPKVAGEQLAQLSRETAASIVQGQEVLLHLLGDKKGQGPQFHALNTMTLGMLLGKQAGLSEVELTDLALAALAHDSGKSEIPAQILKTAQRKKHEEAFFRQHVRHSSLFAEKSGVFSQDALAVIADHHEAVDGSGWPSGKKDLSPATRILAIVDRYDELCSPGAIGCDPLMPSEALATMFRHQSRQFDTGFLHLLIKLLGVYPPGTVVQLSDGALALVIAPGAQSLRPKVLIYCPEMSKEEAPTFELADEPDLKIIESIRPSSLPADVLDWLNPQQRLSYFFSVAQTSV